MLEGLELTASALQEPPNVKSAVVSAGARCGAQVTFAISGSTETYRLSSSERCHPATLECVDWHDRLRPLSWFPKRERSLWRGPAWPRAAPETLDCFSATMHQRVPASAVVNAVIAILDAIVVYGAVVFV